MMSLARLELEAMGAEGRRGFDGWKEFMMGSSDTRSLQ